MNKLMNGLISVCIFFVLQFLFFSYYDLNVEGVNIKKKNLSTENGYFSKSLLSNTIVIDDDLDSLEQRRVVSHEYAHYLARNIEKNRVTSEFFACVYGAILRDTSLYNGGAINLNAGIHFVSDMSKEDLFKAKAMINLFYVDIEKQQKELLNLDSQLK